MNDNDDNELVDPKQQEKEEAGAAANKAGRTAARAAADVYTGGKYEEIRNKPIVGDAAKEAEKKVGDVTEKVDNATGNNFGKIAKKADDKGVFDAANDAMDAASSISGNGGSPEKTPGINSDKKNTQNQQQQKNIKATSQNNGKETTEEKSKGRKIILIIIVIVLLVVLSPIIILFIIISLIVSVLTNEMATNGYYDIRCQEVTVVFTDKKNDYQVTGINTYPLEEYVAGVVAGEVGYLGSIEVDKEIAIAARSYFLTHDNNCVIESSDRKQVFRELTNSSTDQLARQAAEETKGQVLLKDNQIYGTEYDAFCSIAVDENYYTIRQGNQKIPRSWVDNEHRIAESWKQGNCAGNHGRGLSQFGSLYLANEHGYNYEQLLAFYLGNEITISNGNGFISSIPGLEIKDTTNSTELHQNLSSYLSANGSSIDELNAFIKNNVKNNGAGTREGVVTAAISIVNYLYDGLNIRLPYYWGGNYQYIGVNPSFGQFTKSSITPNGNVYNYSGFDCSGFVSWAIKNGGYNINRHTTSAFHNDFSGDSCNVADQNCIGQVGDLINSKGCHVQMIVAVDEENNKYYIVESNGSSGLVMRPWNMHTGNCNNQETRILHMDKFYNNHANVDINY